MMNNSLEWNLEDIFKNEEELENSINNLYDLIKKIKQSKGKFMKKFMDLLCLNIIKI